MPVFLVEIKCELENVELTPNDNNLWKMDVTSDSSEVREGITVSAADEMELEGSRGTAHFIMKWDKGAPQAYIKILDKHPKGKGDGSYKASNSGQWTYVFQMECRGLTPTRLIPGIDFRVVSTAGHVFEDVDLGERDWADYDEENDLSCSISNFEARIVSA